MDIFTTQLTRVVPAQLKPAKLKVRALNKETNIKALTDEQASEAASAQYLKAKVESEVESESAHGQASQSLTSDGDDEPQHQLDIYV